MGLWILGGDEKVIHIDNEPSFSNHVPEGVIHELLEHDKRVAKIKEHHYRFKESLECDKSCLPLVTILDMNVIISPLNVELDEVVSIFQLVH